MPPRARVKNWQITALNFNDSFLSYPEETALAYFYCFLEAQSKLDYNSLHMPLPMKDIDGVLAILI